MEKASITLQDYRHLGPSGDVRIAISHGAFSVAVVTLPEQPVDPEPVLQRLVLDPSSIVSQSDRDGVVRLRLEWKDYNQVSLLAFLDCREGPSEMKGWFEVLRQSPDVLQTIFSIDKPDGFSLLGRTNMSFTKKEDAAPPGPVPLLTSSGRIELSHEPFPESDGSSAAMREAAAIVRHLWSRPVRIGPTSDHSTLSLPSLEQLERIWTGAYPAQCGTFRDIFMSLAAASRAIPSVRAVDLYQGWPAVGDLQFNGHSIAEILDDESGNWIAIDPWNALAFRLDGRCLDAKAMHQLELCDRINIDLVELAKRQRYINPAESDTDLEVLDRTLRLVKMNGGTTMSYFNVVTHGDPYLDDPNVHA